MARVRVIPAVVGAVLGVVCAPLGALPPHAHAAGAAAVVWVADDVTSQSRCTLQRSRDDSAGQTIIVSTAPCPAGSIVALRHVSLESAVAMHRPYMAAETSPAALTHFAHQVIPLSVTADATPNTPCGNNTYHATMNFSPLDWSASIHIDQAYSTDNACYKYAGQLSESIVSGSAWKTAQSNVSQVSNGAIIEFDTDSYSGCYGLPHSSTFPSNVAIPGTETVETSLSFANNHLCSTQYGSIDSTALSW